jgi:hypothetical protein
MAAQVLIKSVKCATELRHRDILHTQTHTCTHNDIMDTYNFRYHSIAAVSELRDA